MTIFHERLVANLKYYRKLRGLSQQKLAESCHLSTNYIGEIESFRKFPSPDTMVRLIRVLGIQPETLFLKLDYHSDLPEQYHHPGFSYAAQLSEALIGYINESIGYYGGKKLDLNTNKIDPDLDID